jgi:hypothetical protein
MCGYNDGIPVLVTSVIFIVWYLSGGARARCRGSCSVVFTFRSVATVIFTAYTLFVMAESHVESENKRHVLCRI